MPPPAISFSQIRSHRSSQNTAFEELTRQLVLASLPAGMIQIEHRGPGADGGVEVLVHMADGATWGWQSKYFIDGFDISQVGQLKKSFLSAVNSYATMSKYYVAIPRNLSGSGVGETDDARKRWVSFVSWANAQSSAQGRNIEIVLWDETELVRQLTQGKSPFQGMLAYWFDLTTLSPNWFSEKFEAACADLGDRYSPQDHVDVLVGSCFDTILRNKEYLERVDRHIADVAAALDATRAFDVRPYDSDIVKVIETLIPDLEARNRQVTERDWTLDPTIDLRPDYELGQHIYETARPLLRWNGDDQISLHRLRKLDAALEIAIGASYEINPKLLNDPYLLLIGEAGAGKSHILAHAADNHLKGGGAAILLLGQYFGNGDPWTQLAVKLGLANRTQDEILGALQSVALATGRPCLIAIDASTRPKLARFGEITWLG